MDITANQVTPQQLSNYATATYGTDRMNQDQWCYIMSAILGVTAACPAYDVGNPPSVQTSAEVFLEGLRGYQLSYNATFQGPGGSDSGNPAASLAPLPSGAANASVVGQGLFGPTNCSICIWLKQNPWAIAVAAVAVYFAFFYKK